jgi:hypothetical protein
VQQPYYFKLIFPDCYKQDCRDAFESRNDLAISLVEEKLTSLGSSPPVLEEDILLMRLVKQSSAPKS